MPKDKSIHKVLVIGSGPKDTNSLFDRFADMMKEECSHAAE